MEKKIFKRQRAGITLYNKPWISEDEYEQFTNFKFRAYLETDNTLTTFETFERTARNIIDQITQHMIPSLGGVIENYYIPKIPLKWPDQYLIKRALAFYIFELVNDIRTSYEIIRDFSVRIGNYNNTWGLLSYDKLKSFIPKQSLSDLQSINLRAILFNNHFHDDYYKDNTLQAELQVELKRPEDIVNE